MWIVTVFYRKTCLNKPQNKGQSARNFVSVCDWGLVFEQGRSSPVPATQCYLLNIDIEISMEYGLNINTEKTSYGNQQKRHTRNLFLLGFCFSKFSLIYCCMLTILGLLFVRGASCIVIGITLVKTVHVPHQNRHLFLLCMIYIEWSLRFLNYILCPSNMAYTQPT